MLKFEKCFNPSLVPKEYLTQLPDKNYDPALFYDFAKVALQSPTHMIYLLINDDHVVKGFLWCEINIIEQVLFVNVLSVDKELWKNGEMIELSKTFILDSISELGLKKVMWATDRPALFERIGFTRSKQIILEYNMEEV